MKAKQPIVHIAIDRPFTDSLEYLYHPDHKPKIGTRVQVKMGRQQCTGLVIGLSEQSQLPDNVKLKPINTITDSAPLLDESLLQLLQWAARYYHHPLGEVIFTALPVALRGVKAIPQQQYWQAQPDLQQQLASMQRAKRQVALYQWLQQQDKAVETAQIRETQGTGWNKTLQALQQRQLVKVVPMPESSEPTLQQSDLQLTQQQQQCIQSIHQTCAEAHPKPTLLHGITGSGKTEIYIKAIHPVLQQGKQVLLLIPEIGLTPQLTQRFTESYGADTIAVLHSGLNDTERLNAWLRARDQRARIIIGTRSAVFVAAPNLGMILIDEEHDLSFKQQEGFRYHARDLAVKRAHDLQIPVILGSATPSLETLYNSDQGRYHYLHLNKRPGLAKSPTIQVQNTLGQSLLAGLSGQTLTEIRNTLNKNEQVMLFINRRGFAPLLQCPQCGWMAECDHCSIRLTYHARQEKLLCHHCGHQDRVPAHCPQCHHDHLTTKGQGTERLELMLEQHFSDIPVIRIDRDSTSRKGSLQNHLDTIRASKAAILVGTQMLAKGHDFPRLTLVIVLDVDQALFSPEYHAQERFGQLLTQVAGRSGRAERSGTVILQTTQPQHPALLNLLQYGYLSFARHLLEERQRWSYPPYAYQGLIRAHAPQQSQAFAALEQMKQHINQANIADLQLLGPASSLIEKRAGHYYVQLLLQSKQRRSIHQCFNYLTSTHKKIKLINSIQWTLDVDPMDLS